MRKPTTDDGTSMAVGAEVRRLRRARGWSLRALAESARLDFGYVGKIERGQSAATDTYRALAGALGVSLSALFAVVPAPALVDQRPAKGSKQRRSDVLDHGRTLRPRRGPATN